MGNSHDPATSTPASAGDSNLVDEQLGSSSNSQLEVGKSHWGTVVRVDVHAESYDVLLDKPRTVLPSCYYAVTPLGGLLGFNLNGTLTRGTRVRVIYDNPAPIVQAFNSGNPDFGNWRTRTSTGSEQTAADIYPEFEDSYFHGNATKPNDFLEGEWEITNMMGVAMQFLTTMMKMQAGERAKVETCLLNDMVRITSGLYRHHSCFGDEEIYNDGGLNHVQHGSKFEHEGWGQPGPQDPKATVEGREVDLDSVAEEAIKRWSDFKGYLGDFIHSFVSDPEKNMVGALSQNRPGKSSIWQAQDGSLVFHSIADLVFERRIRVQIPIEKLRHTDPKSANSKTKARYELPVEPLKNWDFGQDFENAWELGYQLREYARWLGEYHNYARFIQSGDWEIPSEADAPQPEYTNGEPDTEEANATLQGQATLDRYSTIRIFRDGSQMLYDGYGNMTLTNQNGIHHSSIDNYTIDAAGDVRIACGGSFWLKARKHVEIVAVVGGMTLKSRTWLRGLCEWGSIFLKSDAPSPDGGESPKTQGDQPESTDPAPEILDHAIVLDAPLGNIMTQAGRTVYIEASKGDAFSGPGDLNDERGSIILQSNQQDVIIKAKRNIRQDAFDGFLAFKGKHAITSVSGNVLTQCAVFDINRQVFSIVEGKVEAAFVRARQLKAISVEAGFIQSNSVYAGSVSGQSVGESISGPTIDEVAPEFPDDGIRSPRTSDWERSIKHIPSRTYPKSNRQPFWEFLNKKEYYPTKLIQEKGWRLNQSPGQKRIDDDALGEQEKYYAWDWRDDKLDSLDNRTGGRSPFPWGSDDGWMSLSGSAMGPLEVPNDKTPANSLHQSRLRKINVKFYARKPS